MRFWIRVESLKRPPTLFTIPSSFSSSSMTAPRPVPQDNVPGLHNRPVQIVVDHLKIVLAGPRQFLPGRGQAAADDLLALGAAPPQPLLDDAQLLLGPPRRGVQEDRHRLGAA